jgi:hypothetical protein
VRGPVTHEGAGGAVIAVRAGQSAGTLRENNCSTAGYRDHHLEVAVRAADKKTARVHVADWLAAGNPAIVRMNAADTAWHEDDVAMVAEHRPAVMLAKAALPSMPTWCGPTKWSTGSMR